MSKIAIVLAGVLVIAAIVYSLNRGIYVGSEATQDTHGDGKVWYYLDCHYLYPSGVITVQSSAFGRRSLEEVKRKEYCNFFHR